MICTCSLQALRFARWNEGVVALVSNVLIPLAGKFISSRALRHQLEKDVL